jgi:hypothetical protein
LSLLLTLDLLTLDLLAGRPDTGRDTGRDTVDRGTLFRSALGRRGALGRRRALGRRKALGRRRALGRRGGVQVLWFLTLEEVGHLVLYV